MGLGGGPFAPQSFWSLKKDDRTFNLRSNALTPDLLGPFFQYNHPAKKQQKNK